jgi:hypothetical protein
LLGEGSLLPNKKTAEHLSAGMAIYADEHWMALSISLVMVVDPWRYLTSFLVLAL